jgi:hypothetical protein
MCSYVFLLTLLISQPLTDFQNFEVDTIRYADGFAGNVTGVEQINNEQDAPPPLESYFETSYNQNGQLIRLRKITIIEDFEQWIEQVPPDVRDTRYFRIQPGEDPFLLTEVTPDMLQSGVFVRCFYDFDYLPIQLDFIDHGVALVPFDIRFFPRNELISRDHPDINSYALFVTYAYDDEGSLITKNIWNLLVEDYQDLILKERTINVNPRKTFTDYNIVPRPRIWLQFNYSYTGQLLTQVDIQKQSRYVAEWMPFQTHYFEYNRDNKNLLQRHWVINPDTYIAYEETFGENTIDGLELISGEIAFQNLYQEQLIFNRFVRYLPQSRSIDYIVEREPERYIVYSDVGIPLRYIPILEAEVPE